MITYLRASPGFGIAVEEIDRPDLHGRPTIMGGLPHERGTVHELNVAAHQSGVRIGMTLRQAHQHCPEGLFLVPNRERYEQVWGTVLSVLRRMTPLVEPIEVGQAVCDLAGCERHWTDLHEAADGMIQSIYRYTGVAFSLGMGSNRLIAHIASLMPDETGVAIVEKGNEALFLADLPITLLPDLDPRLTLSFRVLGIQTIGQLAALPQSAVERRFGPSGKRLHAYARGIDSRPVSPPPAQPAVSASYSCEDGSPDEVMAALNRLAAQCADELQQQGLAARMVELTLVWQCTEQRIGVGMGTAPIGREQLALPKVPEPSLPVPYRLHSSMVHPGTDLPTTIPDPAPLGPPGSSLPIGSDDEQRADGSISTIKTVVRTPITEAPPLFEQAQRLLLRLYTERERRLEAIELKLAEFEAPVQLGFEECLRLDQTGGLAGLSPERVRALTHQANMLAARYGDTAFRHVAAIDAASVLTERRVRWGQGLQWPERS